MDKKNWQAAFSIEGLTQKQIEDLIIKIVEWVEEQGGYMGGGFVPEEQDDGKEKQP
jgi:hypothetical protein